jgi:iron complex outermembrane recepter protein
VAVLVVAVPPLAQAQDSATQRVEITGSSIKRIAKEGALPVQVIRAEDLRAAGITTAE